MDAEKMTKENLEYKVKMAYEVLASVAESMDGSTVGEYEEAIVTVRRNAVLAIWRVNKP